MNHAQLRQYFYQSLTEQYVQSELMALYHWCVEELHGFTRSTAYLHNDDLISETDLKHWKLAIEQLKNQVPVQHVFGKAYFRNLVISVSKEVLIPRPETEELVQLLLDREDKDLLTIVDIGTGSGCIPLSLKQERPKWNLRGFDISETALSVARQNASQLKLDVEFEWINALDSDIDIGLCDVIISNPPYIPNAAAMQMSKNVFEFEPHLALFVDDQDPFIFFKAIVKLALKSGVSAIYFETHATQMDLLKSELSVLWKGSVETVFDLSGKDRFVILKS